MATMNFLGLDSLASLFKSSVSAFKKSDAALNSDTSPYLAQGSAWGDMADPRSSYFDDWLQAGTGPTNPLVTSSFTDDTATSNLSSLLPTHPGPNADGFVSPSVMLNSVTDHWLPDSSSGKTPDIFTNGGPDTPGWQPTGTTTTPTINSTADQPFTGTILSKTEDRNFDFAVSQSRSDFNAGSHASTQLFNATYSGYDSGTHIQTVNVGGSGFNLAAPQN